MSGSDQFCRLTSYCRWWIFCGMKAPNGLQITEKSKEKTEEEGFEPPVRFPVQRFSRPPVSTAHPFLRYREYYLGSGKFQILDREVPFAIRLLRSESYRSRYGVRMFNSNGAEVRSSFDGNKVAPLRFHLELIAVPERDFQRKRLASLVWSELDFGDGRYPHLAVKSALTIQQ